MSRYKSEVVKNSTDAKLQIAQELGADKVCIHQLALVTVLHDLSNLLIHVAPKEARCNHFQDDPLKSK